MWSYETTRAVSLLTTGSSSVHQFDATDGTQTITGDGLIQSVIASTNGSAAENISFYGEAFVNNASATNQVRFHVTRHFSIPGEDDEWGSSTDATFRATFNGTAGTYSGQTTSRTSWTQDPGGHSASGETISTESGTTDIGLGVTYNYTTSSTGTTRTFSRTTSRTRTESYLRGNTGSYSVSTSGSTTTSTSVDTTTTSTATSVLTSTSASAPTTTTSSRSATFTTSTTSTRTTTETTYATTTLSALAWLDTVVIAASSDWLWSVSTSGTDAAESVGESFTRTTLSRSYDAGPLSLSVSSGSASPGTVLPPGWTSKGFIITTTTSSVDTTYASSYTTQSPAVAGSAISLTTTASATIEATTSTTRNLVFQTTTSTNGAVIPDTSPGIIFFGGAATQVTVTSTVVTTSAGEGTVTSAYTLTGYRAVNSIVWAQVGSTHFDDSTFDGGTSDHYVANYSVSFDLAYALASTSVVLNKANSLGAADLEYSEPAIGRGFQDPRSIGYNQPYGAGFAGGSLLVGNWGLGYPDLFVPLLDVARHEITVSSVALTVQYVPSLSALFTTTSTTNSDSQRVDDTGSISFSLSGTRDISLTRVNTEGGRTVGGWGYDTETSRYTNLTAKTESHESEYASGVDTLTSESNTHTTTTDVPPGPGASTTLTNTYTTTQDDGDETETVTSGDTVVVTTAGDTYTYTDSTSSASLGSSTREVGLHRVTQHDSTGGSESHYESWTRTGKKTSSIVRSDWLAYESLAALYSSTGGDQQYINFPAYPDA